MNKKLIEAIYEQALNEVLDMNKRNMDFIEKLAQEYVESIKTNLLNESVIKEELWFSSNLSNFLVRLFNGVSFINDVGFYVCDYNDPKLEGKESFYYKNLLSRAVSKSDKLYPLRTKKLERFDFYVVYAGVKPSLINLTDYSAAFSSLLNYLYMFTGRVNTLLVNISNKRYIFTETKLNLSSSNRYIKINLDIGYSK